MASRLPVRSAEKWKASYRPGTASMERNTVSPAAPPRLPSSRIASSVSADQPAPVSEVVHASASTSWPMPSEPDSRTAFLMTAATPQQAARPAAIQRAAGT